MISIYNSHEAKFTKSYTLQWAVVIIKLLPQWQQSHNTCHSHSSPPWPKTTTTCTTTTVHINNDCMRALSISMFITFNVLKLGTTAASNISTNFRKISEVLFDFSALERLTNAHCGWNPKWILKRLHEMSLFWAKKNNNSIRLGLCIIANTAEEISK